MNLLEKICDVCDVNPKDVISGSRVRDVIIAKKIFILLLLNNFDYKYLFAYYGHLNGFKRSNIYIFLDRKPWIHDPLFKVKLKDVMELLSIRELQIDFPSKFYNQKINIYDLQRGVSILG